MPKLPGYYPPVRAVLSAPFRPASTILVAVSGGTDSVALLFALTEANHAAGRRWSLHVGHVNHGLRGEDSDEDQAFARGLAEDLKLPFHSRTVDTTTAQQEKRLSLEAAARELRYGALEDMRAQAAADVIALGHTRDDQAETLVLQLLRGSGTTGLAGMAVTSGRLVRPFLAISRAEILQFLRDRGITHRDDASNFDRAYTRNRVRLDVIPALAEITPEPARALSRAATLIAREGDLLAREATSLLPLLDVEVDADGVWANRAVWRTLHPALQYATLRVMIRELLGHLKDLSEGHLERVVAALRGRGPVALHDQLPHRVRVEADEWRFQLCLARRERTSVLDPVTLHVPGTARIGDFSIDAEILANERCEEMQALLAVCGPFHLFADAEALGPRLRIRGRLPGDRLHPLGMNGSRKLQDILVDRGIPRRERDRLLVVENDEHIVWVVGVQLDRGVAVEATSDRVAHLTVTPADRQLSW